MAMTTGKKALAAAIAVLLLLSFGAITVTIMRSRNAAPLASTQPATARPPGITAVTSNGVRLEVVAISNDTQGNPWWSTDGAPAEMPFSGEEFRWTQQLIDPNYPSENRLSFAVRATRLSETSQAEAIAIQPIEEPRADSTSWIAPGALNRINPDLGTIRLCWKTLPEKLSLTIGVAAGPWITLAQTQTPDVATKHLVRAGANGEIEITAAKPYDGRRYRATQPANPPKNYAQLELRYSSALWKDGVDRPESRVVAVGRDGVEYVASGRVRGSDFQLLEIHTPPENIAAVRFEVRPYEPAKFEDISLRPGVTTQPRATLLPAQQFAAPGKL